MINLKTKTATLDDVLELARITGQSICRQDVTNAAGALRKGYVVRLGKVQGGKPNRRVVILEGGDEGKLCPSAFADKGPDSIMPPTGQRTPGRCRFAIAWELRARWADGMGSRLVAPWPVDYRDEQGKLVRVEEYASARTVTRQLIRELAAKRRAARVRAAEAKDDIKDAGKGLRKTATPAEKRQARAVVKEAKAELAQAVKDDREACKKLDAERKDWDRRKKSWESQAKQYAKDAERFRKKGLRSDADEAADLAGQFRANMKREDDFFSEQVRELGCSDKPLSAPKKKTSTRAKITELPHPGIKGQVISKAEVGRLIKKANAMIEVKGRDAAQEQLRSKWSPEVANLIFRQPQVKATKKKEVAAKPKPAKKKTAKKKAAKKKATTLRGLSGRRKRVADALMKAPVDKEWNWIWISEARKKSSSPLLFNEDLLNANRDGYILLGRADSVAAMDDKKVQASEIDTVGGTYHYVKVPKERETDMREQRWGGYDSGPSLRD